MFLFVLQFICCKMVDLAQTNTQRTASPFSPKTVNDVARAVFESKKWEVGGLKLKHLNSFISHEISDFWLKKEKWHLACPSDWRIEKKFQSRMAFKHTLQFLNFKCEWDIIMHTTSVHYNAAEISPERCGNLPRTWITRKVVYLHNQHCFLNDRVWIGGAPEGLK